jgi:protein gp37
VKICALPHASWCPRCQISATLSVGRDALDLPTKWLNARHVFVFPGSDLFARPAQFITSVFAVMNRTKRHEFQLTTNDPVLVRSVADTVIWTSNIWLGALITTKDDANEKLTRLHDIPAVVRFAHFTSPPVGDIDLSKIDFVVAQFDDEKAAVHRLTEICQRQRTRLFVGARVEDAETLIDGGPRALRDWNR